MIPLPGFRDPDVARPLIDSIRRRAGRVKRVVRIMEVCGTHTVALRKHGVRGALPDNIELVSGPGCPVCVTPATYIDNAFVLVEEHGVLLATFGDMLKVPGTDGRSLSTLASSRRVQMVYSPEELLPLAASTSDPVVFLGIGFETTIPPIAQVFRTAAQNGIENLLLYSSFRQVVPALNALLSDPENPIDGFLLPGHVSVIIGVRGYDEMRGPRGRVKGVISGFEPVDMLAGIEQLLGLIEEERDEVVNGYPRAVRMDGNRIALDLMKEMLEPCDSLWRGLGVIPESGMALREAYRAMDAGVRFALPELEDLDPPGCLCGQVIQGKALPSQCPFFAGDCTPESPVGPCMVSSEGTCAAHFRFGRSDG